MSSALGPRYQRCLDVLAEYDWQRGQPQVPWPQDPLWWLEELREDLVSLAERRPVPIEIACEPCQDAGTEHTCNRVQEARAQAWCDGPDPVCPYFAGTGDRKCIYGCSTEPRCITQSWYEGRRT